MYRRLYFIFSDKVQAQQACADLQRWGIDRNHVHVLARDGIDLGSLPPATAAQRQDMAWRLENAVWHSNLAVFGLALIGLLAGIMIGNMAVVTTAAVVMLASFVGGAVFASRVPDVHLNEFRGALAHGDMLMMVDVPRRRLGEIEEFMDRHHPEAVPGGSGWTIDGLGI